MTKDKMIASTNFINWLGANDFSDLSDADIIGKLNSMKQPAIAKAYNKYELSLKQSSTLVNNIGTTREVGFKKLSLFRDIEVSKTGKVFASVIKLTSLVGKGIRMDENGIEVPYAGTTDIWRTAGQTNMMCFEAGISLDDADMVVVETPTGAVKTYPKAYSLLKTITTELKSVLVTDVQRHVGDAYKSKGEELPYNRTFVETNVDLRVDYNLFDMKLDKQAKYLAEAKTNVLAQAEELFGV